jgi:hypothetical protein
MAKIKPLVRAAAAAFVWVGLFVAMRLSNPASHAAAHSTALAGLPCEFTADRNTTSVPLERITVFDAMSTSNEVDAVSTEYFAYVPTVDGRQLGVQFMEQAASMAGLLLKNPSFDVVGANVVEDGVKYHFCSQLNLLLAICRPSLTVSPACKLHQILRAQFQRLELCHWTLLLHQEYYCSSNMVVKCDATSPVFVSRKKHAAHLDPGFGVLAPHDFFLRLKKLGAVVVTDTVEQITLTRPGTDAAGPLKGIMPFIQKYAVTQIRNRDDRTTFDLCERELCDGLLHDGMFKKHWAQLGTTMPIFFYERFPPPRMKCYYACKYAVLPKQLARTRYVQILREAAAFLDKNNVSWTLATGSSLGLAKLGRILPWDQGDVDIFVSDSSAAAKDCNR